MRPSSKNLILDAAVRVTERAGITGLTLESAATEAGVTKGGLMYHFRTRDELLLAVQRHVTAAWEARLVAAAGKPLAEASPRELTAAYARVGTEGGAGRAALSFMVESVTQPAPAEVWAGLMGHLDGPARSTDPGDIDLFLARLAVDGLWIYEATSGTPLPEPVREAVRQRLLALTDDAATD
ncbi:TetR family transcriptional regulator [Streptomyces sp. NPDC000594]|uniref:TetR/AcrR family transcriptional regulator n=1 Tax=Streptomyces sp. NPDC000594 TaxID=3154261 RepID=UPI003321275F